jgi:hypothetical protein
MLRLEALFDRPLIGFDELDAPPWRRFRWAVRASGTRLPSALADALEPWWAERAATAAAPRAARRSPSTRVR